MRRRSIGSVFAKAVTCAVALLAAGIPAALGDDLPRTALAARAEVRGEMPEAQALFLKGQAFEKEGRDAEAVKIYKDAVKRYPEMLAAINGLAYLQATSKDETVRDPIEAVFNAERLCAMSRNHYVTRREFRPEGNVLNPYAGLVMPASFYKIVKINTMAAAYASAGNFTAPSSPGTAASAAAKGVYPEAILTQRMAVEAGRAEVARNPSAENRHLLDELTANLNAYLAGRALYGVKQPVYLEMKDFREEVHTSATDAFPEFQPLR